MLMLILHFLGVSHFDIAVRIITLCLLTASIAIGMFYLLSWPQDKQTCPCSDAKYCERITDTTKNEVSCF